MKKQSALTIMNQQKHNCLLVTCILLNLFLTACIPQENIAVTPPAPAVTPSTQSGSLETYLKAINYGVESDDIWEEPSTERMYQFGLVVDDFIAGNFTTAHQAAIDLGYEIIEFSDTDYTPARTHYILQESANYGEVGFTGGGTYVSHPAGYNIAFEVPHPKFDSFTNLEGIESYLHTQGAYLLLSGTRRESSTQNSPCTGTYQKSDVAHQTASLFHITHIKLSDSDSDRVFLQFHGFGNDTKADLQDASQCDTVNETLINISEGIDYVSNPSSLMKILINKIDNGGEIEVCIYGEDTDILGGTFNAQSRYTNDSPDACTSNATVSSQRFIHIEQSYNVRNNQRSNMAEYIRQALADYFP